MVNNTKKTTRRQFLETTGGTAAALALAGCGSDGKQQGDANSDGNQTTTTAKQPPEKGNKEEESLKLINATISTLDPIAGGGTTSTEVMVQIYDGLMAWPEGQVPVIAKIASNYEVSDNYTTYTFELRQGVTFHNGKEVTADDFVYSWRRIAESDNSVVAGDILDTLGVEHETTADGSYKPGTLAVEAVDNYTFRFNLKQPFYATEQLIANTQFAVIPENIVGDIPGYEGEIPYSKFASKNPIGAGPFKFDRWESGTEIQVTKYENYYGTGPHLAALHWQILESDSAVYNYAMNKNADIFTLPIAQYTPSKLSIKQTDKAGRKFGTYGPLRNGETVNYLSVPQLSINYIGFNMQTVPQAVRQALAYALNQQTIAKKIFKGLAESAYHYTLPTVYPGRRNAYSR